jgi:hypothetical protein
METYGKWDHSKPKTREDYNVTPEMPAPYIGLRKRGYELKLSKEFIYNLEQFISKSPDFYDNRISKTS